jgi:hypothetical protein
MHDRIKRIAFDVQGHVVPEELLKPLRPIAKRLAAACAALTAVDNDAAKREKTAFNKSAINVGLKEIQHLNTTKEVRKEAHRENRRAIKAAIKTINAEAVPYVRKILQGIREPVFEFVADHLDSERKWAEIVGVVFQPSVSLTAAQDCVKWLDSLIAGNPTLATLDGIPETPEYP